MVVEHTFITTLEPNETMQAAVALLGSRGFENAAGSAFPVGQNQWTVLEMRRGKKKAARAKNIADLPQTVHLHWDRGRVTVALSIEPSAVWGGGGGLTVGFGLDGTPEGKPKKMKLHTELLMSIAAALEQVLAHRQTPAAVTGAWDRVEADIRAAARRRLWRNAIIILVFFALIAGLITLAVMSADTYD